jgi:hypothetical protein
MRSHASARLLPVSALVLLLVGLLALPALAAQEVRLTDDGFSPRTVRVDPGEDIVWINATDEVATVVGEDGTWDSGPLQPGETFSVALRQPGTVRYATADGEAEGQIRVRPAADQVATEDNGDEADAADDAAPAAALPNTGQPAGILLGFALLLVGFGAITLHRADALQVRAGVVRH